MARFDVDVQLTGHDGNAFNIIGRVANALRKEIGDTEASEWTSYAMESSSYDELLRRAVETVNVS